MSDVSLSKAVRQNLLSLQSTASSMAKTQNRLATGLKVNTALDNPTNFFTAASLNGRAGDMSNLLDSMSSGIKTIEAADNGLSSITKTVESMQSTLRQARQDKSFKSQSFTLDTAAIGTASAKSISLSGGGASAVNVSASAMDGDPPVLTATVNYGATSGNLANVSSNQVYSFDVAVDGGPAVTVSLDASDSDDATMSIAEAVTGINKDLQAGGSDVRVRESSSGSFRLQFYVEAGEHGGTASSISIGNIQASGSSPTPPALFGFGTGASANGTGGPYVPKTVDAMVSSINGNASLSGKVRASNDGGKLRIENLSTEDLTVTGIGGDGEADGSSGTALIGGNDVRKNLVKQFNDLRDQLDKFADDASFNGINLLRGDKLKLNFNESGTSTIDIQAEDEDGAASSVSNRALGIDAAIDGDFDSDAAIDERLDTLKDALGSLRSQSSTFGSNLSVVENRNDFTKKMINTLETGAANLTLADTNEEAANLLALQTRQQLSSSALSMASQADQAVLRLF
jgi:flagellin-like hook-associated protein FlgL